MRRVVLLGDGAIHRESALGSLGAAGFEAVVASDEREARLLVEGGAIAVVATGCGEEGSPLRTMSSALRRGLLMVLVCAAEGPADALGVLASGADLILSAAELPRLGELVSSGLATRRALVAAVDAAAAARLGG